MGYHDDMVRCRAYIEEHLEQDIDLRGLADMFNYSYYYFRTLFHRVNGHTVYEYIRIRRLTRAAQELRRGKTVTEVAARYGFDTASGFTKAFRQYYGISPSGFKKMKGGITDMTPEIKKLDKFSAAGYVLKAESEEPNVLDNGAYWLGKDFGSVSKEDYQKIAGDEVGLWMHNENDTVLFYFFGSVLKEGAQVPAGLKTVEIPAAEYAVFKVPAADNAEGLSANVKATWREIFDRWFDGSEYRFDEKKCDFEFYSGDDTFIYVPVVKK
ncbi:MAG: AraC family transcriptional regulator [Oscillospiraceae bacterium]|nr:AraC family transcriptional regulator [Oscillospiraceae bacterium]